MKTKNNKCNTKKNKTKKKGLNNKIYQKELVLLKKAADNSIKKRGKKNLECSTIKRIIEILENYLKDNDFVCYGGTAINNILPAYDQFYKKKIELPDYDFFSSDAFNDAKKLADIYYDKGFDEVEAKAGVHYGTYKVYVNYIPIADITQLDSKLFTKLKEKSINIKGINYADPNYLRMAGYLELSRPHGDVSRWEKVFNRISLLNKHYPINEKKCDISTFIRKFEDNIPNINNIYKIIKNSIIDQGLVFFGGFALYSYGKYLPNNKRKNLNKYPEFDVLAIKAEDAANSIKNTLRKNGINNITISKKFGIGEIISEHYQIKINNEPIIFVYQTTACHSYNIINVNNKKIKIATIDTMLSLYLAFLYAERDYYDIHRIICIAEYLFYIQSKNRIQTRGVLKRFSINCYGKQETLEDIRGYKSEKYKELKNNKTSKEYQNNFLRYYPLEKYSSIKKKK